MSNYSMFDFGYIYALINPSMEGMVKVGKTTKQPNDRAKNLSSSTGVPTNFIVAYEAYVNNCSAAESYVHTMLEEKGFRVSSNREFFNAPLPEVIKIMLQAQEKYSATENEDNLSERPIEIEKNVTVENSNNSSTDLLDLADSYYEFYPGEDNVELNERAISLYEKAAALGYVEAYLKLGKIYNEIDFDDSINPEFGTAAGENRAIEYFKKGAGIGCDECWAELGIIFMGKKLPYKAEMYWKKYKNSNAYKRHQKGERFGRYSDYGEYQFSYEYFLKYHDHDQDWSSGQA